MRLLIRDPITGGTGVNQDPTIYQFTVSGFSSQSNGANTPVASATCRMSFLTAGGTYQTYDQKYVDRIVGGAAYMLDSTSGTPTGIRYTDNWKFTSKSGEYFFERQDSVPCGALGVSSLVTNQCLVTPLQPEPILIPRLHRATWWGHHGQLPLLTITVTAIKEIQGGACRVVQVPIHKWVGL
jgi:hypothetical protein